MGTRVPERHQNRTMTVCRPRSSTQAGHINLTIYHAPFVFKQELCPKAQTPRLRRKNVVYRGADGSRRRPTMQFVAPSTVPERRRLLSDGSASRTTSEQSNIDEPGWLREDVARAAANEWRPIKLLQLYAYALEQKPLLVKAITSGFLGALRNLLAQCILWSEGQHAVWNDKQARRQTLAVALEGVFFTAPVLHYLYGALDRCIPAEAKASYATIQVVIDVCVINPVCGLIFIFVTGFLEGKSFEGYMVPTVKANYLGLVYSLVAVRIILIPFQVYLFNHFPVKWRVLISDGRDVLWVLIASFAVGPAR